MQLGAILSDYDIRDYQLVCTAAEPEFPKEFELEMGVIKDQGNIMSCVAHALSSIIEYYNKVQHNDLNLMSVGYIYGNRLNSNYKRKGMMVRDALDAVCKYGDVYHELFPYNVEVPKAISLFKEHKDELYVKGYPNRLSQYCKVNDEAAMKSALMAGNPILIATMWYNDMKVVDGVLTTKKLGMRGGHCMLIYGWDERGWKMQNSWGTDWGDNGCAIIPYDMTIDEKWLVSDDILETDIENIIIEKPFSSKLGEIIAKVINFIINLFKKNKEVE